MVKDRGTRIEGGFSGLGKILDVSGTGDPVPLATERHAHRQGNSREQVGVGSVARVNSYEGVSLKDLDGISVAIVRDAEEPDKEYIKRVLSIAEKLKIDGAKKYGAKKLERALDQAVKGYRSTLEHMTTTSDNTTAAGSEEQLPRPGNNMQDQMRDILQSQTEGEPVQSRDDEEQGLESAVTETLKKMHRIGQLRQKKISGKDITELSNLLETDLTAQDLLEEDFLWVYNELLSQFSGPEKTEQRKRLIERYGDRQRQLLGETAVQEQKSATTRTAQESEAIREAYEKNDFDKLAELVSKGDLNPLELKDLQIKAREHKQWTLEIKVLEQIVAELDTEIINEKRHQNRKERLSVLKAVYEKKLVSAKSIQDKVSERRANDQIISDENAPLVARLQAVDAELASLQTQFQGRVSTSKHRQLRARLSNIWGKGKQFEQTARAEILSGDDQDEKLNLIYSGTLPFNELANLRTQVEKSGDWVLAEAASEAIVQYWGKKASGSKNEKEKNDFQRSRQAAERGLESAKSKVFIEKKQEFIRLRDGLRELLSIAEQPDARNNPERWKKIKFFIKEIGKRFDMFSDLPQYKQAEAELMGRFERLGATSSPDTKEDRELAELRKIAEESFDESAQEEFERIGMTPEDIQYHIKSPFHQRIRSEEVEKLINESRS